jgi:hypothetical protein
MRSSGTLAPSMRRIKHALHLHPRRARPIEFAESNLPLHRRSSERIQRLTPCNWIAEINETLARWVYPRSCVRELLSECRAPPGQDDPVHVQVTDLTC